MSETLSTAPGPPAAAPFSTPLTTLLQVRWPVMAAGMGGIAYHELVAAVANAGGYGCLGVSNLRLADIESELKATSELTSKPFGVDLLVPSRPDLADVIAVCARYGVASMVWALGVDRDLVLRCHDSGMAVGAMCGSPGHVTRAVEAGCDFVIAQGSEAGGHTGQIGTFGITQMARRIAGEGFPIAAAGGISTGRGLVAAMALGADGVWMGTRFAATREAHARKGYQDALVKASSTATVVTRAYSGKPMRVLRNQWVDEWERRGASPQEFRDQLRVSLDAGVMSMLGAPGEHPAAEFNPAAECMPAGQDVGAIDAVVSAADMVRAVIREATECSTQLASLTGPPAAEPHA